MKVQDKQEVKKVFKAIFAWEDEKEEKWLEEMAAKGWKLENVVPYFYTFRRSTPEKMIYRLDYKYTLDKDYQEYLTLFKDAGWELLASFANWHYFRISPQNEMVPEIYNSDKAKAQKYRRLMFGLTPLLPLYIFIFNPATGVLSPDRTSRVSIFYSCLQVFMVVFLIFFIYAMVKVFIKIKKLESPHKE